MRTSVLLQVIHDALPWDDLREIAKGLLEQASSQEEIDEAAAELAAIADAAMDWERVRIGIAGKILEQYDGPIARALLRIAIKRAVRDMRRGLSQ